MTMPVLTDAIGPEEDWTGLRDAKERRKLQTRLNVRAHRRRKALLAEAQSCTQPHATTTDPDQIVDSQHLQQRDHSNQPAGAVATRPSNRPQVVSSSSTTPWFPLSLDHLIRLVQYNFIRGIMTNIAIVGHQDAFPEQCQRCWVGMPLFPTPVALPESLRPTALQRSTPHEPWIDLIPDRQMRDNAILAMIGLIGYDNVAADMTGGICGDVEQIEIDGTPIWKDPWSVEGWELTEGFIKKWPFLVKGCWKWLESTNRWRAIRGEEPLVVEL
ncbi:hypothetical protein F4779DRAFT_616872 [Xylariaceae sp. FL0662B]|nr:hypothetical protein F4779DRAFT_616872 [Xylariaceae sp. FL0662B]